MTWQSDPRQSDRRQSDPRQAGGWRLDASAAPATASAVVRAYAPVHAAIVSGALAPGTLITEGEVAERLALSRTPVREAFLLLASQGLLTLHPKKGAVVVAVDDAQTAELVQARIMVESTAVRLRAARPHDPDPLRADLDAILTTQREAAASGDALAFARADHAFHSRVVAESANRVIDDLYARLGPRLELLTHRVVSRDGAALGDFLDEHTALAEHAVAGRAREYEAALADHVERRHSGSPAGSA